MWDLPGSDLCCLDPAPLWGTHTMFMYAHYVRTYCACMYICTYVRQQDFTYPPPRGPNKISRGGGWVAAPTSNCPSFFVYVCWHMTHTQTYPQTPICPSGSVVLGSHAHSLWQEHSHVKMSILACALAMRMAATIGMAQKSYKRGFCIRELMQKCFQEKLFGTTETPGACSKQTEKILVKDLEQF